VDGKKFKQFVQDGGVCIRVLIKQGCLNGQATSIGYYSGPSERFDHQSHTHLIK